MDSMSRKKDISTNKLTQPKMGAEERMQNNAEVLLQLV